MKKCHLGGVDGSFIAVDKMSSGCTKGITLLMKLELLGNSF